MPSQHATLSPSASERWISCPASVRLAAQVPGGGSSRYADEGTHAHTLGELLLALALGHITQDQYDARYTTWREQGEAAGYDVDEMVEHCEAYRDYVLELAAAIPNSVVMLEQRVFTGIEGCWGTSDVVIVSPIVVVIVDLKYGAGVRVLAKDNPQLMLYAVGALDAFGEVLGDVENVAWHIFQPRVSSTSSDSMAPAQLRAWRDGVIPIAEEALAGSDRFGPSDDACRWCPVAGTCRARVEYMTQRDFGRQPDLLAAEELGELLATIPEIKAWCQAVEAAAMELAYDREQHIPGWKVVLSGGKRVINNTALAIELLEKAGYDRDKVSISEPKMRTLATLDKVVGKAKLPEVLAGVLVKTPGRPSLVKDSDNRASINPSTQAAEEFS